MFERILETLMKPDETQKQLSSCLNLAKLFARSKILDRQKAEYQIVKSSKDLGANYLLSVFWTLNFVKKYWISMKILSPKILDFYENT